MKAKTHQWADDLGRVAVRSWFPESIPFHRCRRTA